MSHSQLLVLFLLSVQSLSIFGFKEYNQSDFCVDHLVMSSVESSLVLLEEGVCYDQCIFLAKFYQSLPCFIPHSKDKFVCYSRCFLTSYFCIPVPYNAKDIFVGCQFQKVFYRSSQSHSTSASSAFLAGAQTWITVTLNGLPWKSKEMILSS